MLTSLRRFWCHTEGASIIEFAFAFPIFLLFLIFISEYGLMMFGNSVIRSTVEEAAHYSKIGCLDANFTGATTCDSASLYDRQALINNVKARSFGLVKADDCSLFTFSVFPPPNMASYVSDSGCGTWNPGNGTDIRVFKATYKWPVMFAYMVNFGFFGSTINFTAMTVTRNEPFGDLNRP